MPISSLLKILQQQSNGSTDGSAALPNILIIITDQERALQHWPLDFSEKHLPSMERLKKHGIDFQQHYTNTCCCSPSRSTLLTSLFPVQTGVTRTGSPGPPIDLPTDIPNIATVMKQAGYKHVHWYGKWHLGKTPASYGFEGWVPPDAGNYLSLNDTLGGGDPNNDGRFLDEVTKFLKTTARRQSTPRNNGNSDESAREPFCVVASFVNPHDVYVAQHQPALGYTPKDFQRIQAPLPSNYKEDPDENNKPRAQGQMSIRYVPFENDPQDYVNFYAYLHTVVDAQIGSLLDVLDDLDLTDSTLILRTADHGEQALSHSLVEKFYNCYQESIHIPFVVSNPIAFPKAESTTALTSHLDILPTLFNLGTIGASEKTARHEKWKGKDLTPILEDPQTRTKVPTGEHVQSQQEEIVGVQPHIHFTYDDISCPGAPSVIRCIRTLRYKYAVYFTPDGLDADWELYNLISDPLEDKNHAGDPNYTTIQERLEKELQLVMDESGTLPTDFQWPPSSSPHSRGIAHTAAG
ncbi:MAG: hypothetical protein SGILL_004132 [Bacillariaceae sp.]